MNVGASRDGDGGGQARTCRALLRQREVVRQAFGPSLCANANWDMLLALYLAECEDRTVMLTALCAASHVPEATAYRKIDELERRGMIVRTDDPQDRRRVHVRLSGDGITLVDTVLRRITRIVEGGDRPP